MPLQRITVGFANAVGVTGPYGPANPSYRATARDSTGHPPAQSGNNTYPRTQ